MPLYEVRRRTVLASSAVEAKNETEARFLARDVWVEDAKIAALCADVERLPLPPDDMGDDRSEARYVDTPADHEADEERARRWES